MTSKDVESSSEEESTESRKGNDHDGSNVDFSVVKHDSTSIKVFESYVNQVKNLLSDSMYMMTSDYGSLNFQQFWSKIESIVAPSIIDDTNDDNNEIKQRDYQLIDQFDNIAIVGHEEWVPEVGAAYTYVISICQVQGNKVILEYWHLSQPLAFTGKLDTTTAGSVAEYNSGINVHELSVRYNCFAQK